MSSALISAKLHRKPTTQREMRMANCMEVRVNRAAPHALSTDEAPKGASAAARQPARGVFGGIPTFFLAACHTAAQGGSSGYATAGWHLANSVASQMPYDLELDEWIDEIEALQSLAAEGDIRGVWDWFARHYPRAMALIPARRRDRFVEGVLRAWEEGRISA